MDKNDVFRGFIAAAVVALMALFIAAAGGTTWGTLSAGVLAFVGCIACALVFALASGFLD